MHPPAASVALLTFILVRNGYISVPARAFPQPTLEFQSGKYYEQCATAIFIIGEAEGDMVTKVKQHSRLWIIRGAFADMTVWLV